MMVDRINNTYFLFLLCLLSIFLYCSCKNNVQFDRRNSQLQKEELDNYVADSQPTLVIPRDRLCDFTPDTTVNGIMVLRDRASISSFVADVNNVEFLEGERDFPVLFFVNKDISEYLAVYQYPGDSKGVFSVFEFGVAERFIKVPYTKTEFDHFYTENGLMLNMTFDEVLSSKSRGYELFKNDRNEVVRLRYEQVTSNCPSLKGYDLPLYFWECELKDSIICTIKFGFEYP